MLLFSRNKTVGVQTFLLNLVNKQCPELVAMLENRRDESRVPLCQVALVVPLEDGKPDLANHFHTVTKEFSTTGVSIVLDQPRGLNDVIIGLRWETETTLLRGAAKHLNPMGAGFFHLGIQLSEVVRLDEYPELEKLTIF